MPRAAAHKFARQPVTPGSTMTQGDLARQRHAAIKVRYGPQLRAVGQEIAGQRQLGRDMTGWYSDYLAELAAHRANVDTTTTGQNTALAGLQANVRAGDAQANQQQAGELQSSAGQRGATAGAGVQGDAGNAANVRQQMLAAFAGQLAGQGRTATDYADTLAHVVGPGQRLQAQAQNARALRTARQKRTAVREQAGAFGQQYADQVTAGEAKNVLAQQALGLDTQKFVAGEADKAADRKIQRTRIRASQDTAQTKADAQAREKRTKAAKERAEHVAGVRKDSSTALTRLHDIRGRWHLYGTQTVTDKATGKTRPPTDGEIRERLVGEKFTTPEIDLALAWRRAEHGGGFLTPAEQALAHQLGIRIPRRLIESKWVSQNRPT